MAINFAVALQLTGLSYGRYDWTAFAVSYGTPTATPTRTATATATPTHTPRPNGADCTIPSQCASTFCVNGVCCDTICDQPGELCGLHDHRGVCTVPSAPAPALRGTWLFGALLLLIGIGALAVRNRRTS